jgi:hypothetical protein
VALVVDCKQGFLDDVLRIDAARKCSLPNESANKLVCPLEEFSIRAFISAIRCIHQAGKLGFAFAVHAPLLVSQVRPPPPVCYTDDEYRRADSYHEFVSSAGVTTGTKPAN